MPSQSINNRIILHIGFIVPFLYRFKRGIERSCIHLANELVCQGQNVTLIAWLVPGNEKTPSPLDPRIRIVKVPYVRYYQAKWAIPFYISEFLFHPYDIVNLFYAGHGEAEALYIARKRRSFHINFIAGYPIELVPDRYQEFRRFGLDGALDSIIVKSPSMAPSITQFFRRDVTVIPNGVDTVFFDPEQVDAETLRARFGLQMNELVLLTVAALEERKGIHIVIEALPKLMDAGFSVRYFVVGEGSYREQLESLILRTGLSKTVHLVGEVADVRPYYRLADLFLLVSKGEGFPNALLEAWSMGLPTIVSKHPPYPDIIHPSIGVLVDECDIKDLSALLSDWLAAPDLRRQASAFARTYVQENYAWPVIARRYIKVFIKSPRV